MLASITPLGERGRQSTWGVTVAAFLLGATAAGVAVGAAAGAVGRTLVPLSVGVVPRMIVLGVAALAVIALDAGPCRVPGPRRQVNELWLARYRGWVYGVGYGAQLGVGVSTVVSSGATYLALLAALAAGSVAQGAVIMGVYGAIRGLTPLAMARVRDPAQLMAAHARLLRLERPVALAAPGALGLAVVVAAVGALA